MSALVLDTNIVLDLLLFQNPQAQGLRQALDQQQLRWLAICACSRPPARWAPATPATSMRSP